MTNFPPIFPSELGRSWKEATPRNIYVNSTGTGLIITFGGPEFKSSSIVHYEPTFVALSLYCCANNDIAPYPSGDNYDPFIFASVFRQINTGWEEKYSLSLKWDEPSVVYKPERPTEYYYCGNLIEPQFLDPVNLSNWLFEKAGLVGTNPDSSIFTPTITGDMDLFVDNILFPRCSCVDAPRTWQAYLRLSPDLAAPLNEVLQYFQLGYFCGTGAVPDGLYTPADFFQLLGVTWPSFLDPLNDFVSVSVTTSDGSTYFCAEFIGLPTWIYDIINGFTLVDVTLPIPFPCVEILVDVLTLFVDDIIDWALQAFGIPLWLTAFVELRLACKEAVCCPPNILCDGNCIPPPDPCPPPAFRSSPCSTCECPVYALWDGTQCIDRCPPGQTWDTISGTCQPVTPLLPWPIPPGYPPPDPPPPDCVLNYYCEENRYENRVQQYIEQGTVCDDSVLGQRDRYTVTWISNYVTMIGDEGGVPCQKAAIYMGAVETYTTDNMVIPGDPYDLCYYDIITYTRACYVPTDAYLVPPTTPPIWFLKGPNGMGTPPPTPPPQLFPVPATCTPGTWLVHVKVTCISGQSYQGGIPVAGCAETYPIIAFVNNVYVIKTNTITPIGPAGCPPTIIGAIFV